MFGVSDWLAGRGHQVIPFSITYRQNRPTPFDRYFVEPLSAPDEVTFREHSFNSKSIRLSLERLFYAKDVEQAVIEVVNDTSPQVAYILHYLRKLSPSILVGIKKSGLPIVVRLSDYGMLCPQAHFYRNGSPCELCLHGNIWHSVIHGCVQSSRLVSLVNAMATYFQRNRRFFDLIDIFIVPSKFMFDKMIQAGYPEERLRLLTTFVDIERFRPLEPRLGGSPYVLYLGRLVPNKGVQVLLDAWNRFKTRCPDSPLRLKIVGTATDGYDDYLKSLARELELRDLEFVGHLRGEDVVRALSEAFLTIVPSLWYENLPNAILESYACGTPVLTTGIGSLKECVREGETGYLFRYGDANDLADKLVYCWDHPEKVAEMAKKARSIAVSTYSPGIHLAELEALFNNLVQANKI